MALRQGADKVVARLAPLGSRLFASPAEIQIVSGLPPLQQGRKVTIYSPARTAGQQGVSQTAAGGGPAWKIQHENKGKWINPLMGWTSTADPLENVGRQLYFSSKEEAVTYAEKNGWEYEIEEYHNANKARPKRYIGYGDNFSVKRKGLPTGGLRSEQQGGRK
ncbi:NADH dehydrogenase [ubiquinone] iron-sulfur mitochondrial [Micractinium conductrix]|uniref:NADH dehydrogenase [ubiquinone] iron-sulfur protein 4, mitochondrial n=1 Tax=Micractinium conductrix TaxID=554055 RepID=A0A2P6VGF6_9CHLO|nr:NADH dehydrogenase [ubiquinone] iron-sulfur mitochondrial [Micractinium conductrix]|eukprot:PSC73174.1 NADH dehydrogenase [ubiquinone] iron-sulfur mitochondrial [Micractinium conductrix]